MKVKSVLDIISHLMGEKSLSKKEMNEYDVNNDGVVDKEDLISMWEVFAKDESEPKFYKEGQLFVNAIRKLLTSGIYTRSEAEDIFNRMTKISSDNKLQSKIVYNDNQNPAFQITMSEGFIFLFIKYIFNINIKRSYPILIIFINV